MSANEIICGECGREVSRGCDCREACRECGERISIHEAETFGGQTFLCGECAAEHVPPAPAAFDYN